MVTSHLSNRSANFYPRPPRGGRHWFSLEVDPAEIISIHALREEGDTARQKATAHGLYFYPRPPRGGRPSLTLKAQIEKIFLSTPSARRATYREQSLSVA